MVIYIAAKKAMNVWWNEQQPISTFRPSKGDAARGEKNQIKKSKTVDHQSTMTAFPPFGNYRLTVLLSFFTCLIPSSISIVKLRCMFAFCFFFQQSPFWDDQCLPLSERLHHVVGFWRWWVSRRLPSAKESMARLGFSFLFFYDFFSMGLCLHLIQSRTVPQTVAVVRDFFHGHFFLCVWPSL